MCTMNPWRRKNSEDQKWNLYEAPSSVLKRRSFVYIQSLLEFERIKFTEKASRDDSLCISTKRIPLPTQIVPALRKGVQKDGFKDEKKSWNNFRFKMLEIDAYFGWNGCAWKTFPFFLNLKGVNSSMHEFKMSFVYKSTWNALFYFFCNLNAKRVYTYNLFQPLAYR